MDGALLSTPSSAVTRELISTPSKDLIVIMNGIGEDAAQNNFNQNSSYTDSDIGSSFNDSHKLGLKRSEPRKELRNAASSDHVYVFLPNFNLVYSIRNQ